MRRALPDDLDRVVEIENLSFAVDRFSRRQYAYLISQSRGIFFVAESEGVVVGYVSLLTHLHRRNLRIYAIAVHPEFRERGIARRLLERGKQYAAEQGLTTLSLEVRMDNTSARRFYEKNGFVVTSLKPDYFEGPADGCRMEVRV